MKVFLLDMGDEKYGDAVIIVDDQKQFSSMGRTSTITRSAGPLGRSKNR
jgi:hypothetical protein